MVDLIPVDHEPEFHEPEFDAAMPPAVSPEMLSLLSTARERLKTQPARLEQIQPTWTPEAAASADQAAMMPETYVNPYAKHLVESAIGGIGDFVSGPGKVAQPNPYPEGSEQWHSFEDYRQQAMSQMAPQMALTMVTGGGPKLAAGETALGSGAATRTAGKAALDMSEEARLTRAKEQGYDTSNPIYHGTSKDVDFKKFKDSRHGTWTSTDPADASAYAKDNDSQGYSWNSSTGKYESTNTAARVLPMYAKPLANPYVVKDVPDWIRNATNYKKAQSDWFDQLRREGYDGLDYGNGIRVYFNNANLRSQFAPFDPKNEGKSMILGSGTDKRAAALVNAIRGRQETTPGAPGMLKTSPEIPPAGQKTEAAYKGPEGATPDASVQVPAAGKAPVDVAGGVAGPSGGDAGVREAQLQAERRAAGRAPLPGLPQGKQIVEGEPFVPGPVASVHDVADRYMADKDFGVPPPEKYHEIDKEHSKAIADAYDKMEHAPNDPAVKASYDALIRETLAQYQAIKDSGLKITPVGAADYPYHGNPRAVAKDIADNNHMAFFKTDEGFGTGSAADAEHPMLQPSGEKIGDHELLNNDLFRIVHDYFGHVKNGYGFRGAGEDNAWRAHAAMYSPEARPAMTAETRGQNSWVNYGPHGDFNRTASGADTIYAPQKVGLMPDWTMQDRGATPTAPTVPGMLGTKPPEAAAGAAPAAQGAGGLSFPAEEAADRLRMKLQREQKAKDKGTEMSGAPTNDRTVVKAPEGSNLPDFVAGKITPQDWVARHEKLLSPEEIAKSSKWYDEISDHFLQQANGDKDKAAKYMRAWLVAQQNVDVGGAMGNALLQREQVLRGVPENEMKAAGMPNPTVAARRVFQDQPIEGGVGHKIADFVDAAEGKDVRSWMGNDPRGGAPFVVDVHTARDTGLVDQRLVNHLERLGYDPEALKNLKLDWGGPNGDSGGLSAPTYENRAKFGRELTDHLNDIKWQGRDDWKPREVQAVGWMGMTKMTANQADDVATGLAANRRHLSMELAPGEGSPWAAKYGDRFAALPPEAQRQLTHQISEDAINRVSQIAGVDVRDIVHGTGGWQTVQNPSTVAQAFASKQGGEIAANALGHLLQQTEVWSNKVKPVTANPKGFAVDFIADGNHNIGTDAGLRDFWSKIMAADPTASSKSPLFQGYQPIKMPDGRVGIRALIDRGGVGTKTAIENAISGPIKDMVEKLPHDVEVRSHEAEIYKAHNDWTKDKDGQAYRQRLVDLVGPDRAAQLDSHGAELEKRFSSAIEAAESAGTSSTSGTKKVTGAPAPKAQAAPPSDLIAAIQKHGVVGDSPVTSKRQTRPRPADMVNAIRGQGG